MFLYCVCCVGSSLCDDLPPIPRICGVRNRGKAVSELNANTGLHTGNSQPDVYTTCDVTECLYLIWKVNVLQYNRIILTNKMHLC